MTEESQPEKRVTPDWERIELDYRAGVMSLREIAAKDGNVTEGAIRKKAKKLGWPRDLNAKIQAKADDLVRKEVVRTGGTQLSESTERTVVETNATAIADIKLGHRKDIRSARTLVMELLEELQALTKERLTVDELLELVEDSEQSERLDQKRRDALYRVMSLPGRSASIKALSDSLKTLVGLEREAWGLDADKSPTDQTNLPMIGNDQLQEALRSLSEKV